MIAGRNAALGPDDGWEFALTVEGWQPGLYVVAGDGSIAVLTLGAGYVLGLPFAWLPGVGAAVIAWALWRSDRKGFIRSRQMRRAHEPQRHFSPGMVFVLSGLFVVNVLACFYIWLTAS